MKKRFSLLFFTLLFWTTIFAQMQKFPEIISTSFKKDSFNIENYGAKADGITLNTISITAAINACVKNGGGVVVIPKGFWLTGPLVLQSNVNLCVQRSAVLQFTKDFSQYKMIATSWEGVPAARNESPLSATNATNIAITGAGIIDGNGDAWRAVKKDKLTESQWNTLVKSGGIVGEDKRTWYPSASSQAGSKMDKPGVLINGKTLNDFVSIKDFLRPNLLVFTGCNKILLEGVTFQNSAAWCLHPLMSSNLTIKNITVKNPWYAQNGDGIDIESCSNVLLENSNFDVGDDGICIKSGRDEEGRKRNMPTKNVIVRNCVVYHAHGGFVIGSEMSGGANNIYVNDCTFIGTDIGLRFKTTRGRGGIVENIFVKNITMKDISGEAILFDMYYMAKDPVPLEGEKREEPKVEMLPVTEETPRFRNFDIKNIVCNGAARAIFIRGLPEMNIHDIKMKNISITSKTGIEITEAKNIDLDNVKVMAQQTNPLINIFNSSNISFSKFSTQNKPEKYLRIGGVKTAGIKWTKSPALADADTEFEFGANKNALQILP